MRSPISCNLENPKTATFIAMESSTTTANSASRLRRCCKLCRPGPSDVLLPPSKPLPPDPLLDSLFSSVSALKSAYISLQQAHLPYNPDNIRAADALIVAELQSLSHISHLYHHHHSPSALSAALRSKTLSLDSQLHRLKLDLHDLDRHSAELDLLCSLQHQHLTPSLFSNAVALASDSIHAFAKPLIGYMKASGWDLDSAADAIETNVNYSERSHKKYAFEAYVSRVLFFLSGSGQCCFEMSQFDRIMCFQDAFDALLDDPDSGFARFCRGKYLATVHPKMERSFFGDLDHRRLVLRDGHPRTPFYRAFARMARWVWAVRVLARSFIPEAGIFCARKGQVYEEEYMESVVNVKGSKGEQKLTVGLTVMPGFKIGRNVVRCRVYLCSTADSC